MRNELQHIEQIERYLNNQMTADEKSTFEQLLQEDPSLATQVQTQQLLMQAAIRKAIKADIAKYGATGGNFNWAKWTGITGGVILVAILSYFSWFSNDNDVIKAETEEIGSHQMSTDADTNDSQEIAAEDSINYEGSIADTNTNVLQKSTTPKSKAFNYTEDTHCGGLKTWIEPEKQIALIDPKKGKTIEGKEGTLIIVPTDAFVDQNGDLITDEVSLELVEALRISDMIAYNLTTMNDNNALHSGGMIYVQPYVNGEKVNINPERPIYIEIPTEDYQADMKAWEGVIDQEGNINWKNPKDLEKYLTIVDFDLLNFLPNGFEEAVAAGMPFKTYKTADKELVDSLYYSLFAQQLSESGEIDNLEEDSLYTYDEVMKFLGPSANMTGLEAYNDGKLTFREWLEILFGKSYLRGKTTLIGHVEDQFGKRIPNAKIQIVQNGFVNKQMITTDNKGYFTFNKLEDGDFVVYVTASGYDNYSSCVYKAGKDETFTIESALVLNPSSGINSNRKNSPGLIVEALTEEENSSSDSKVENKCFVSPQSVKTIKTDNFGKTFLSTKEFEDRIKVIHQMPRAQQIFDLYVNNLSKNLWEVDEMAAKLLTGNDQQLFKAFAAQKLTNVKDANIYQDQLSAYYNEKKKENEKAAMQAAKAYQQKSEAELVKYQQQMNQLVKDYNQLSYGVNSTKKLPNGNVSLSNVNGSKRLNFTIPTPSLGLNKKNVATASNSYATPWYTAGWMNIDAYLHELSYGEQTVQINTKEKGAKIYQCLNLLKTVIPLTVTGIIAKAKFPKQGLPSATKMEKTYAIGIKKDQDGTLKYAEKHYNPYTGSSIEMEWKEVSPAELMENLQQLDGATSPLVNEIKAQEEAIRKELEIKAQKAALKQEMDAIQTKMDAINKALEKERAFISSLERVVNSCGIEERKVVFKDELQENNKVNVIAY